MTMDLYGVVGRPILHSLSPALHNAAFAALGLDARYLRFAARSGREALRAAEDLGLKGFNVTAPFKEELAALVEDQHPIVRRLEAANTIVRRGRGWKAFNTDAGAVAASLTSRDVALEGARALVLGAGGAARAAAFALSGHGARVTIANRTPAKARRLARELGCEWCALTDAAPIAREAAVVVNTASTSERLLPPSALRPGAAVLDARYQADSVLVRDARRRGCALVSGREWLVLQGWDAFRLFTRREAPLEAMFGALERPPAARGAHLALVGFMGAGKTSVGQRLARRLGLRFFDTDQQVERASGVPVPELIRGRGEAAFRSLETAAVRDLPKEASVVSCGGGIVTVPESVEALRRRTRLIVWLWANPETSVRRIGDPSSRPLLGTAPLANAKRLLAARRGQYAAACDVVVNTEGQSIAGIAERVRELWEEGR